MGLLVVPASAGAVLAGENGRIVFTSGRNLGDPLAQLFLLPVPSSTGGGTVSPPITSANTVQHRHATWSPDRTRIAYARGDAATANFDIYIQDLTDPGSTPLNITNSPNVTDDRPAWSPEGTRIAWESEVTDGSNQRDILLKDAPFTGGSMNFTNTTMAGQFEGKPAWSPDSATLYYEKGNSQAAINVDIVKKPAGGGSETLAVSDSGISEFQPSISPDGTKICFTLSNNGFNNTADVLVGSATPPTNAVVVSKDLASGDYNCTWSPDGQFVAYVTGIFTTGQLVMVRADNTSPFPIGLAQDDGANNFDGNPDWAPDGRPLCPDITATTTVNTPVTVPVACTDTGPAYEQTEVREFVDSAPANGTATQNLAGDPVTYTPNQGFTGTDSFQIRSFDELGFGTDTGTVTIAVQPAGGGGGVGGGGGGGGGAVPSCGGRTATIVGTDGSEPLVGTNANDVIVGLRGNDRIRGGRGRDIICGGSGGDRLNGGRGGDRIGGGKGNDRIGGGFGNDRLAGGAGRDRLSGNSGRDRLNGGPGRDRCTGGSARDRASRCERTRGVP